LEAFIASLQLKINSSRPQIQGLSGGKKMKPDSAQSAHTSSSCSQVSCYSCDVGAIRTGVFRCSRRLQSSTYFSVASTPERIGDSKGEQRLAQQIGYIVCSLW